MRERSTIHRAVTLASLAFALATLCQADVVFTTLPTDGAITVSPLETVGWGYSIQNQTANYLLPIGLSNSGVLFGALSDIFDYPVVDPGPRAPVVRQRVLARLRVKQVSGCVRRSCPNLETLQ